MAVQTEEGAGEASGKFMEPVGGRPVLPRGINGGRVGLG